MKLEDLLYKAWKKIISKYAPLLDPPKLVGLKDGGALTSDFDLDTHRIRVNPEYVEKACADNGIDKESLLELLLTHETFHHLVAPYDSETAIKNALLTNNITLNKNLSAKILEHYYEMKVHSVHALESDELKDIVYKTIIKPTEDINDPNETFYADVLATRLGIKRPARNIPDPAYEKAVSILGKLDYLRDDENDARLALFTRIFMRFVKEDAPQGNGSVGTAGGQDVFSQHDGLNGGKYGLGRFSTEELTQGLKEMTKELDITQFNKMLSDLGLKDALSKANGGKKAGRGGINDVKPGNILYFLAKSESYNPPKILRGRKVYDLYQSGTSPFDINDDELEEYDAINSFGQLTGPLARKKEYAKSVSFERGDQKLGDLLIIKDTSASMDTAYEEATTASLVMAKAYLNGGADVSVYNFSSERQHSYLPAGKDIWSIAKLLVASYSDGTEINIEDIKKKLGKNQDILLFTDLEIANLEELLDLITTTKNGRVAVFLKSDEEYYDDGGFLDITKRYKSIKIYKYKQVDDPSKMVIKDINDQIGDV